MCFESINSLLAQTNQLVGPVDFGSAVNIHKPLHRGVEVPGTWEILRSRL